MPFDPTYKFEELALVCDRTGFLGLLMDGEAEIEVRSREDWSIDRIVIAGEKRTRGPAPFYVPQTIRSEIVLEPKDAWFATISDALLIRRLEEIQELVDEALADDGVDLDRAIAEEVV